MFTLMLRDYGLIVMKAVLRVQSSLSAARGTAAVISDLIGTI